MSDLPPLDQLTDLLPSDRDSAMEAAIWAWADHTYLPHTDDVKNRVACALFAALGLYLTETNPDARGWMGIDNKEFATRLKGKLLTGVDMSQVGDAVGLASLAVSVRDGLVALEYAPDLTVVLPPETARKFAVALLTKAGEIDDVRCLPFFLGVPPYKGPEEETRR